MAAPAAYNTLSLLKMAREAKHGDYDGSESMGTISIYDITNGGNTHGSTVSYPEINTDCDPNPDHDHNGGGGGTYTRWAIQLESSTTSYKVWFTGDVDDLGVGDTVYVLTVPSTYVALTSASRPGFSAGTYWVLNIDGCGGWQDLGTCLDHWDAGGCAYNCPYFTINSSGVITAVGCGCP